MCILALGNKEKNIALGILRQFKKTEWGLVLFNIRCISIEGHSIEWPFF